MTASLSSHTWDRICQNVVGCFSLFSAVRADQHLLCSSEFVSVSAGSSTDYEPVCGRPHGVRLDRHGQLIVADSYFGLNSVDPKTGEKTLLLANSQGTLSAQLIYIANKFPAL